MDPQPDLQKDRVFALPPALGAKVGFESWRLGDKNAALALLFAFVSPPPETPG